MIPGRVWVHGKPPRVVKVARASVWAPAASASPAWICPLTCGLPVTAVPGNTPRSPVTTEGPVLVTVAPARTA